MNEIIVHLEVISFFKNLFHYTMGIDDFGHDPLNWRYMLIRFFTGVTL